MDQYIGKMLDNRYEVLDLIGIGGMAMVYKAYCHRLHRFVAIKILRRDFAADSDFRRRFHDEAQAVAMLSHPNIVSVYDISRNDDLDYIVMELIDGITLKQYMKKKNETLGWREALHYITQIMRALSHAHSRGIIHRDIKPQNIMVLRDGSVRVADFGIARVMSAAQNTLTQETLGSVHYISPEQARGSNIDERADIYSAGVVLYEMLTGRLPFEGDSPVSVAIQHISAIPLSPRDLSPDIPEALEVITLKAMASKIERRYRNAEEMIRDLEEFRKNPNINFDYEHQQDLIMQAAEEPTQVIDTGRIARGQKAAIKPLLQGEADDYDYEIYDDFRETTGRRGIAKREPRLNLIPVIAVVVLFLLGVGIFVWVLLIKPITNSPESITIPSFLGKTLDELNADSEYQKLFIFIEAKTKPSNEYEANQVMSQEPKPNSTKKRVEGSKIEIALTISSGQEMVMMIDLTNMPHQEALLKIQEMGLEADSSDYGKSDDIVRGNVISHIPLEGERVPAGTKVKLTLSEGPDVKQVVMPTLIDQTEIRAKKMLDDLKLIYKIDYLEDSRTAGIVFYQSVPSAQTVDEGSVVTLHVSTGPSVPVTPPDSGGTTPELGGRKSIDISLPTDRENVIVKVTVDGEVKFEVPVNTANNSKLTREIDGVGNQTVRVFIDGQLQEEYDLDFSR